MTDVAAKLRKLDEQATKGPWRIRSGVGDIYADFRGADEPYVGTIGELDATGDIALLLALRNALPEIAEVVEAAERVDKGVAKGLIRNVAAEEDLHNALAALKARLEAAR